MTSLARAVMPTTFLVCAVLAAAGCGEVLTANDSGVSAPDATTTDGGVALPDATPKDPCEGDVLAEDLTTCFLEAVCGTMNRCYGTFPTVEECVIAGGPFGRNGRTAERGGGGGGSGGDQGIVTDLKRLMDAVGAGKVVYSASSAGTCVGDMAGMSCPELFFADSPTDSDACKATFTGTVADAAACYSNEECQTPDSECDTGGAFCELQCCVGTCSPPHKLTEDCGDNFRCEDGAHCVTGSSTPTCTDGSLNAICTWYGDCDKQFWCDVPATGGLGTCKADFTASANCTDDAQCPQPQRCVGNDLTISNPLGVCAAVHTEAAACDGRCDGPFWCDWENQTVTGTCKPFPGLNENCGATFECQGQLWCDNVDQLCKAPKTQGVTCVNGGQCGSPLFCTSEIGTTPPNSCSPAQANGSLCAAGHHCASGVCESNGDTPPIYRCVDYASCY